MNAATLRSVTIFATVSLEREICEVLRSKGARGYSLVESQYLRAPIPSDDGNVTSYVRFEAIVEKEVAYAVVAALQAKNHPATSVVYFLSEVLLQSRVGEASKSTRSKCTQKEERWGDYLISL
jgi:hypothetical protein